MYILTDRHIDRHADRNMERENVYRFPKVSPRTIIHSMVLIADGNSEYVTHAYRKKVIFL